MLKENDILVSLESLSLMNVFFTIVIVIGTVISRIVVIDILIIIIFILIMIQKHTYYC